MLKTVEYEIKISQNRVLLGPHGPIWGLGPVGPWAQGPWAHIFRRTCLFFAGLACFCHVCCPPSHHTPIHKGIHKGGRRPPPLWMNVWWLGGQQTWQKQASPAKNKQVRRKIGAQGPRAHGPTGPRTHMGPGAQEGASILIIIKQGD